MRFAHLILVALVVDAVPSLCVTQTQRESESDSVAVVISLNRVQAPFAMHHAGALHAVRSALKRIGSTVVRVSPNVITVSVSAHVIPPVPGVFPSQLEPLLEEVEWRVRVSYFVRGSGSFTAWRNSQGRSPLGTWAAESTMGVRTAVLSAVRAHSQRNNEARDDNT